MCPISCSDWNSGRASLQLMKSAPSSPYAADYMTVLMILDIVNTDQLFGGNTVLFDMKKCTLALLLDFVSERYKASLRPARTMSLACYVIMASGWVAA